MNRKNMFLSIVLVFIQFSVIEIHGAFNLMSTNFSSFPPPCESEIYCYGKLVDTIQMAKLFDDSKHFVDMKLKLTPNETIKAFYSMMDEHQDAPTRQNLIDFVLNYFEDPGKEFEDWVPTDWKDTPTFLSKISDTAYREWANHLNKLWLELGRKMTDDVSANSDKYSIIYVKNPVIVPGGRFREFYYWDSYWIIRGLLLSEMFDTVKGMLSNFLSLIDRFEFIPNGGRYYYSKRSQPPLLSPMIKSYVEKTNDTAFAIQAVETLEKEFLFWMNNHTIEIDGHTLAVYGDQSRGPRPESYREDVETTQSFETEEDKNEHFAQLKAAAESGMDFSSRWFINDNGTNEGDLTNLKCRYIVPVELNSILYWNAKIISEFYQLKQNSVKVLEFEANAEKLASAIQHILWHDDIGVWLDYDHINNKRREYFTPTNLSPLWMNCTACSSVSKNELSAKVLNYIDNIGINQYPGGVPNTLANTGEQWDFPNVWPPMQYILIAGLRNLNHNNATELAYSWAEKWVLSNYIAYKGTDAMFEKYSAEELGGHGGGGEYVTQTGFGWTNGVVLELLDVYGHSLKSGANITIKQKH